MFLKIKLCPLLRCQKLSVFMLPGARFFMFGQGLIIFLLFIFPSILTAQGEVIVQKNHINNAVKAIAICAGQDGIPICLENVADLRYFHALQPLSFAYQDTVRDALLYSVDINDSNHKFIHDIAARGTWIQYECENVRFKLQLGVHGHLYGHYSFNVYLKESTKVPNKMAIAKIQIIKSMLQEITVNTRHTTTYDLQWIEIPEPVGRYYAETTKVIDIHWSSFRLVGTVY